jgi:hypothetical protein
MSPSKFRNLPIVGFAIIAVCITRILFPGLHLATLFAILVGLSNIKAFPFAWHVSFLSHQQ